MSVTVVEKNFGSRKTGGKTGERTFVIKGATDDVDALSHFLSSGSVPTSFGGLIRQDADCTVEEFTDGTDGIWIGTAHYANPDWTKQTPADSFSLSFDISGTQTHITQSRSTVNKYYHADGIHRDFQGSIGVDSDGTINGCDILVPTFTYQMTYTHPEDYFDDDGTNLSAIYNTVGAVNSDTFHGFAAGSQLLTKVSGQKRADRKWDFVYGFAYSKNETSLTVGTITGIAKKGWDYLWVYYERREQTTSGSTKYTQKLPVQVNIEQVYPTIAYSGLGI